MTRILFYQSYYRLLHTGLSMILISASMIAPVHAQLLEEIVVTAQKREQNLQDVSISVSVFSGDAVRNFGWTSNEEIAAQTPGLIGTSFSGDSTVSLFAIRGVGQNDFADHQEAPSAVYVDGAYVGFTGAAGIQMFDLNRVEVLRGPQGTLFGRNATGGLIHLISNRPTEEFEAYGDITVAEFDQIRFEGAISGPLTGNLSGRLSVMKDDADGYFENSLGKDARDRDFLNVRAQLDYSPTEWANAHVSLWSNRADDTVGGAYDFRTSFATLGDSPTDYQGSPDSTPGANDGALDPLGDNDKEAYGITGTITLEAERFTVTSITDYADFKKFYEEDSDGNPARSLEYIADQDSTQFSQEIRINGEAERSRWVAGFYFLNLDGDYFTDLNAPTFGGAEINNYTLETNSWSIFGQIEHDFTEQMTLVAGLRWITDEKDYELNAHCQPVDTLPVGAAFLEGFPANDCALFTSGDPANPLATEFMALTGEPIRLDRKDEDVAANVRLNYQLNDEVLLYLGFSRGMKGGGFTAPLDGFLTIPELIYEPEILHSYELGFKSSLLDDKARLNASVFYYDYMDYQAFVFQGLTTQVRNQDAEIYGAEFELFVSPSDNLELAFGGSFLDATVKDVELSPGVFADQQMITAPDVTLNFLGKYTWTVGNGSLAVQVDGIYVDKQQYNTTNSPLTLGDDYTLWNARASYSQAHGDNDWEVSVFVKNLADEEYFTYLFDLSAFFGYSLLIYGPPRWAGGQFRYNWR